ncbi:MAG: Gfo/Idh/MocA family oxidoreductase [Planctomycetia bacterium]|nr:Gfo/Idh/MocA family oxidoreductase [Planctomycetia bacterium]
MNNDKLGICLVGAGRAGMIHARNYFERITNADVVCVVDAVSEAAEQAASELKAARFDTDYRNVLDDDRIDAVVIAAPTDLHKRVVLDFADAGKSIFCEKPMGVTVAECDEMIQRCEANKVILQIGFMRRHDSSFVQAKEQIAAGDIGDIVLIQSCTRGPSKPKPWMYDISKSNGILAEVNSHDIDSVRWFAESEMDQLYAIAGNFRNREIAEQYPDYYDNLVMSGTFKNGIQFVITGASYVQYGYDSRMEIVGTKGRIQIGRNDKAFYNCTTPGRGTCTPFIESWTSLFHEAYLAEDRHFVDCVLNGRNPKVTGLDGRMAVHIVEVGNESIRERKIKKV